jgi:hypothetical protein
MFVRFATSIGFNGKSVAAAVVVACLSGAGASCRAESTSASSQPWQALVIDSGCAGEEKCSTVWTDGKSYRRISGFVVTMNGKLQRLSVRTSRDRKTATKGDFPYLYEVGQLIGSPLTAKSGNDKVLLGADELADAKELLNEFQAGAENLKPLKYLPATTESYTLVKMRPVAIFGDYLGVEIDREQYQYGHPAPEAQRDLACYRLKGGKLTKCTTAVLPANLLKQASTSIAALPEAVKAAYATEDLGRFLIKPGPEGMKVTFALSSNTPSSATLNNTNAQDPSKWQVIDLKDVAGQGKSTDGVSYYLSFSSAPGGGDGALMRQFLERCPLKAGQKVKFYSVAPDGSAAVYAAGGKLFFQAKSAPAKELAAITDVEGVQWHNGNYPSQ